MEYRTSGHAVSDINYHLIWITKYRYKVLRGEVAERARDLIRQICQARERVRKMLRYAVPPGYRRKEPAKRPRLGPWLGVIDAILEDDKKHPQKQRHTAKRIFGRLRAEHAYTGGSMIVKDYVRQHTTQAADYMALLSPQALAPAETPVPEVAQ
jgi:transposase